MSRQRLGSERLQSSDPLAQSSVGMSFRHGEELDARHLGGEAGIQIECGWHVAYFGVPLVLRPGSLPASHSICADCKARIDAELDEREAGELRQLRIVGDVIASFGKRR